MYHSLVFLFIELLVVNSEQNKIFLELSCFFNIDMASLVILFTFS